MSKFLIGSALALALSSTSLAAAPIHAERGFAEAVNTQHLWLAKGNNGNGNGGNGNKLIKKGHGNGGNGKPGKANGNSGNGSAKPGKGHAQAGNGKGDGKPEHAGGAKAKAKGSDVTQAAVGNRNGSKVRHGFSEAERQSARAPFAALSRRRHPMDVI